MFWLHGIRRVVVCEIRGGKKETGGFFPLPRRSDGAAGDCCCCCRLQRLIDGQPEECEEKKKNNPRTTHPSFPSPSPPFWRSVSTWCAARRRYSPGVVVCGGRSVVETSLCGVRRPALHVNCSCVKTSPSSMRRATRPSCAHKFVHSRLRLHGLCFENSFRYSLSSKELFDSHIFLTRNSLCVNIFEQQGPTVV